MLSQHVWKTGNPIRSLDLKLSCDIKVVPHGTRSRPDIDDAKLVQNATLSHTIHVHMLTQHNQESGR